MVKVAIAAQAEHADDPAKVMAGLNSVLAGKLQGQFVTAAYLFLDLGEGNRQLQRGRDIRRCCTTAPLTLRSMVSWRTV